MIAFNTGNVLKADNYQTEDWVDRDGCNYILSIKSGGGYCISKVLVTSFGAPCQLTIIIMFDRQADIAAIPELLSSVYIPWRATESSRLSESAHAFINAGLNEQVACCAAIAVNIIYDVIDRGYMDYAGEQKDCTFTSSGMTELNDECRERVLFGDHVVCDCSVLCTFKNKMRGDDDVPF